MSSLCISAGLLLHCCTRACDWDHVEIERFPIEHILVPAEPPRSSYLDMELYQLVENLMNLQAPKAR